MNTDNDFINWLKHEYPQIKIGPIFSALEVVKIYHRYIEMKNKRGGKREGAGRPKLKKSEKKEPTKVMRIPHSKVGDVKKIIKK